MEVCIGPIHAEVGVGNSCAEKASERWGAGRIERGTASGNEQHWYHRSSTAANIGSLTLMTRKPGRRYGPAFRILEML
jgi:hypothetical protein